MVHLTGYALPVYPQNSDSSSSSLFDDLHHLNTLDDHRDHNRSGRHAQENDQPTSVQRPTSAPRRSRPSATARGPKPLLPRSLKEALQLAELLSKSKLIPKGFETPETCLVGILYGMEVGLSPIAALQRMAVIDGRPTIWGDAALALVQSSGLLQSIHEEIIEDENTNKLTAICRVEREGRSEPVTGTFSVDDAKRAGLWQKPGPWTDYPKRMLTMRARAFALRDAFPDVLAGLYIREEFETVGCRDSKSRVDQNQQSSDKFNGSVELGKTNSNQARKNNDLAKPTIGSDALSATQSTARRAPPPPKGVCFTEPKLESSCSPELLNSSHFSSEDGDQHLFDPEIILDLFDSALCCALDLSTLEEIIDEFAERLRKLPDDAQQRAQRIIERHQSRVEDLDRSTATDHSASDGASEADHNRPDPEVDQHEVRSDVQSSTSEDAPTLPRGLKSLLPHLGLGHPPLIGRRRKIRDIRARSFASWNAQTSLSDYDSSSIETELSLTDPTEMKE